MKYLFIFLPFIAIGQVTFTHQDTIVTVTVNNPLSEAVDLSNYHEYYQEIPAPYWNVDFNNDGMVNSPDMTILLSHYGEVVNSQILLTMLNAWGRPPGYFDRLRIELFSLFNVYSSGTLAYIDPELEVYCFNDRTVVLPYIEDDVIIQYTAPDEETNALTGCSPFQMCADTFTLLLFTTVDGVSVIEKHFYAKR